nr:DOG1 domain-containing protein [Tanacetum cinerariifolium]
MITKSPVIISKRQEQIQWLSLHQQDSPKKHNTWKQDDRGKDDYEESGDYLKEHIQCLSLHQQDSPKLAMNKLKKMTLRFWKHNTWKQDDRGKDDYEESGDYLKEHIRCSSLHQQDSPKL